MLFDGATDYRVRENEVLYVRHLENGQPINRLISLSKVKHAHADGIVSCIESSFEQFKLPNWDDMLVGMCADGASVNLGQSGGVVAKLRERKPHLIDIHCMAHRLELALKEVQKQNNMVAKVDTVLNHIYATYHHSPKSKRDLETICQELETRFYSPCPVKGTRWVPHLDRALEVFLATKGKDRATDSGEYSSICLHMDNLAGSQSTPAATRGKAMLVVKEMKSIKFMVFCHFLTDIFEQLASLSLEFQRDDLILPSAITALNDCMATLELMKADPLPGGSLEDCYKCLEQQNVSLNAQTAANDEASVAGDVDDTEDQPDQVEDNENSVVKFQGIELGNKGDVSKAVGSLQNDFSEVIDLTTGALENRFENLLGKNPDSGTQAAVQAFSIFMHDKWPTERGPLLLYGCKELDTIVEWFTQPLLDAGCEIAKLSAEWRKLKLTVTANFQNKSYNELYKLLLTKEPYLTDHRNILYIVEILLVLPISSANCEPAFSAQKRIITPTRTSMSTSTASDLILISTEGPELADFKPNSAIKKWKQNCEGQRRPQYKMKWPENIVYAKGGQ